MHLQFEGSASDSSKPNAADKSPFAGKDAPRKQADWNWVSPRSSPRLNSPADRRRMVRQAAFKGCARISPPRR